MAANGKNRLETWKEVAAFFGKDERTVRRWEDERGLPIHRLPGGPRSRIYAEVAELEAWLRSAPPEAEPAEPTVVAGAAANVATGDLAESGSSEPLPSPPAWRSRTAAHIAAAAIGFLAIIAAGVLWIDKNAAEPAHIARVHTPSPETRRLYEAGLRDWQLRTPQSLSRAHAEFTDAVRRDPEYAAAWAGLADCYNLMREFTLMPASTAYPLALAAARRAVQLDPNLAAAHRTLAFVLAYWVWDVDGAEREFKTAIALDPKSALSHHWYGTFLSARGQLDAALAELAKAEHLDPNSRALHADRGVVTYEAGRKGEGVAMLRAVETADPSFIAPHKYLAWISLVEGDDSEYLREAGISARMMGDLDEARIIEAGRRAFALGGRAAMLEALLAERQSLFTLGRASAYQVASLHALLGHNDDALRYLSMAVDRHESELISLRSDMAFAGLFPLSAYRDLEGRIRATPGM